MSLSRRTFLIIILSLVLLIIFLSSLSAVFILKNASDFEQQRAAEGIERIQLALDNELATLDSKVYEWSVWDDTYDYIVNPNDTFIEDNFGIGSSMIGEPANYLVFSKIDILMFHNLDAEVVMGRGYDKNTGLYTNVPDWILSLLTPDNPLFVYPNTSEGKTGLLLSSEGMLLTVTRPVLDSAGNGPSRGTVLMGRYLDDETIARLEKITLLPLTIALTDDPHLSTSMRQARLALDCQKTSTKSHVAIPLDSQTMAVSMCMADVYGESGLLIQSTFPRTVYRQGVSSIVYLIVSLLIGGIIIGGLTLTLLQRGVVQRLTRLSSNVRDISKKGMSTLRLTEKGNDEIASLTYDINAMIDALVQTRQIQAREERYALAVRGSNDGLWDWDIENNTMYFSSRWKTMLGYQETDIGDTLVAWFNLIHPDDQKSFKTSLETHRNGQTKHFQHEYRMRHKNGNWHWMLSRGLAIQNDQGTSTRMAGSQTDISELKLAEEVIQKQETAVRELSMPLIPLADRVLLMPLIGSLDASQILQMNETLLKGITSYHGRIIILDATGLDMIDTEVAHALLHMTQAVKLLGAQLVLSGIRPDVAQTLVHFGSDLGQVRTFRTLQEGVAWALNHQKRSP